MKSSIASSSRQFFVYSDVAPAAANSDLNLRIIPFPYSKTKPARASLTHTPSDWEDITFIALGVSGLGGVVLAFCF